MGKVRRRTLAVGGSVLGVFWSCCLIIDRRVEKVDQWTESSETACPIRGVYPATSIDVLVLAWQALAENGSSPGISPVDIPDANRAKALEILAHDAGRGSTQVITLRYNLLCISHPFALKQQLELVEQLATTHKVAPQLRLEYAILLFQNGRAQEGDNTFRMLRNLWRESEHFVEVPERLRWLRGPDGRTLKTVKASVSSERSSFSR